MIKLLFARLRSSRWVHLVRLKKTTPLCLYLLLASFKNFRCITEIIWFILWLINALYDVVSVRSYHTLKHPPFTFGSWQSLWCNTHRHRNLLTNHKTSYERWMVFCRCLENRFYKLYNTLLCVTGVICLTENSCKNC